MRQPTQQTFQRGKDRILGGVCSGLAARMHIDPLWVRLGFVLLAFLQGIGLFVYVVLWLVMPEPVEGQEGTRAGLDSVTADLKRIGAELRGQFGRTSRPEQSQEEGSASGATSTSTTSVSAPAAPAGRQSMVLGVLLVVVGLVVLGANTGLVQWSVIWPTVLIILGVLLLARSLERRR